MLWTRFGRGLAFFFLLPKHALGDLAVAAQASGAFPGIWAPLRCELAPADSDGRASRLVLAGDRDAGDASTRSALLTDFAFFADPSGVTARAPRVITWVFVLARARRGLYQPERVDRRRCFSAVASSLARAARPKKKRKKCFLNNQRQALPELASRRLLQIVNAGQNLERWCVVPPSRLPQRLLEDADGGDVEVISLVLRGHAQVLPWNFQPRAKAAFESVLVGVSHALDEPLQRGPEPGHYVCIVRAPNADATRDAAAQRNLLLIALAATVALIARSSG